MRKALVVGFVALVIGGCRTPSEGDRQVNHQQKMIGQYVEEAAPTPEIKQAGADVKANAETLEKNLIGKPEKALSYTPENSKKSREQSDSDHSLPLWLQTLGGIAIGVAGWFLRGGAVSIFAKVAPTFAAGPLGTAATLLVEGIARVRENAEATGGQISVDSLLTTLKEIQEKDPRAQALIQELAHRAEAKLAAKL
jgi:hypothetical protein